MGSCISTILDSGNLRNDMRNETKVLSIATEKNEGKLIRSPTRSMSVNFADRYELIQLIGTGGQSSVYSGKDMATSNKKDVAVKVVNKYSPGGMQMSRHDFQREIVLLDMLHHRGIMSLHDFFEEQDNYIFVMEYAAGGDLTGDLLDRGALSEHDAKKLILSLTKAVAYMHSKGIVHRDLKCDNILLRSPRNYSDIMIGDFGFAVQSLDDVLTDELGTPHYMAPELLEHIYGKSVDIWAIGVILFIALSGHFPFDHRKQQGILNKIMKVEYSFDDPRHHWSEISEEAKSLISHILVLDVNERYTSDNILNDPWLADVVYDKNIDYKFKNTTGNSSTDSEDTQDTISHF